MHTTTPFVTIALAALSILTSLGVAVHDGHIEQVVANATSRPTLEGVYIETDDDHSKPLAGSVTLTAQHVHADYNPMGQSLANTFSYQDPSIAPRRDSHHKQLLRTLSVGGRHAFDNTNLPILD